MFPAVTQALWADLKRHGPVALTEKISIGGLADEEPITLARFDRDEISIQIDGVLDEPEWAEAQPLGKMRVLQPDTREPVPYRTDVKMLYTDKGLYVAFDMEQPKDSIIRRISGRDARLIVRDRISFTIDTSGTGLYGYWMSLALGDNQMDGTILPERRYASDWDGAWYGASKQNERGWVAEVFIPWSQTAMPKVEGTRHMGVYVSRNVAQLNQTWGWPAINASDSKFISVFQKVALSGVDPRKQWSVFPYVSGTRDEIDKDFTTKAGFDLFWRPSSNFQLTSTINPDFGSVESDNVDVNLTANETFFPEKRLFFQEGQEIFQTTPRASDTNGQVFSVLNTRRIGGRAAVPEFPDGINLSTRESRKFAPLYGALKTTGQFGNVRYGVLAASEKDVTFGSEGISLKQAGRDFAVARFLYESKRSGAYKGIGIISTRVSHPDRDAIVHGLDFHYLTSKGTWNVDGQLLYSDVTGEGKGKGGFMDITYTPHRGSKHTLTIEYLDNKLNINDLGFQIRNNSRVLHYQGSIVETDFSWVRDVEIKPFVFLEVNGDGHRTKSGIGSRFNLKLHNLDQLNLYTFYVAPIYDDRNSFGNGTFKVQPRVSLDIDYETDPSRTISFSAGSSYFGERIKGRKLEAHIGFTWRPRSNINMELNLEYIDRNSWLLHQGDKDFTTFNASQLQPRLNLDYYLSAKQQFRIALQWIGIRALEDEFFTIPEKTGDLIPGPKPPGATDDFSLSQLNFQVRYRWQIAPLSDLFIVYTKTSIHAGMLDDFDNLFQSAWEEPVGDQVVIKLRYRLGS